MTGLAAVLVVLGLRYGGFLQFMELLAYDWFLGPQAVGSKPDDRIVLVTIGEEDIRALGRWPLTDRELARLIRRLLDLRPSVIGLDIYRDFPVGSGAGELGEVFATRHPIVGVWKMGDKPGEGIGRPYPIKDHEQAGFCDIPVDPDGVVRRGLLFMEDEREVHASFALLVALHYLQGQGISPSPGDENPHHLKLGRSTVLPLQGHDGGYAGIDARGYQILLDFRGRPFRSWSARHLYSGGGPPPDVAGKVVLVGSTAESLKDLVLTPLDRRFPQGPPWYGVEVHAALVSQLIRSAMGETKPVLFMSEYLEVLWILGWGLAGSFLGLLARSATRFSLFGAGAIAAIYGASSLSFSGGLWVPSVPPLLSFLVSVGLMVTCVSYTEKKEKQALMALFSKSVSRDVAEALWEHRERFARNGRPLPRRLIATVLFTDLQGFTTISEELGPEKLLDWLNGYMEAMVRVINAHGGVINKFIGDSVMAVFGVPIARESEGDIARDALRAVECAVDMRGRITALNERLEAEGLPLIRARVGIFTGPLVAGCLGGPDRLEYTVLGDTVNVASRLEGFGKDTADFAASGGECRILAGEATIACLGDRFETVPVGEVFLKGRKEAVRVYLVTTRRGGN